MGVIDVRARSPEFGRLVGHGGIFHTVRQRAASFRLERVQCVPLPAAPHAAHGAPLPHRAGIGFVADSHPGYERRIPDSRRS